jgi:hypothetical protein
MELAWLVSIIYYRIEPELIDYFGNARAATALQKSNRFRAGICLSRSS